MAATSDEEMARRLQAQFDEEETLHQQQMTRDASLAASKAHTISDSDSDVTIEPPEYTASLDGSLDLFDTSPGSAPLNDSRHSSTASPTSRRSGPKSSSASAKKTSSFKAAPVYEISDSDSDIGGDNEGTSSKGDGSRKRKTAASSKSVSVTSGSVRSNSNSKSSLCADEVSYSAKDSTLEKNKSYSLPKLKGSNSQEGGLKQGGSSSGGTPRPSSSDAQKSYSIPKLKASTSPKLEQRHSNSMSKLKTSNTEQSSKSGMMRGANSNGGVGAGPSGRVGGGDRPECKYGDRCYRTNPEHLQEFHKSGLQPGKRKESPLTKADLSGESKKPRLDKGGITAASKHGKEKTAQGDSFGKTVVDVIAEFQPLSLFLTKVSGIDGRFNNTGAVSIKDILSPLMGNLEASCQFNYMIDVPWLVEQYPRQFRDKPLLLVHGEQKESEARLKAAGAPFPNVSFCKAKLEILFGTHHTKMMLLLYDCGMRVVIHTANLVQNDWFQKTQGVWISPLFPKLHGGDDISPSSSSSSASKAVAGDSPTKFKADLLAYLASYRTTGLTVWERHIHQHDFSAARVYLVASTPGRHTGDKKTAWGHLRLRKILQEVGPEKTDVGRWPVIGQFSSIGSLGATPDQWLCDEWLGSLSQCKGIMGTPLHPGKLQLVYPSKENVRLCLEGYGGGGCLPYTIQTARKQIYLNNFVRKWGCEGRGRTGAIPHIKTYSRVSPDHSSAAWFMVTSANLSKAAWGALEKQRTQLMIRSYEIGVLFLPQRFGCEGSFPIAMTAEEVVDSDGVVLPFPYDLPPPTYQKGDRIWMWDVPCVDKPDTHGKKYCPAL